ncbi:hypothetical protein CYMTET_39565 [Cymbomonas tetramitiformis]|uniref:DUF5672 domain-containing protein n=1 Tax=Cymbomonas tetramitiformis TaxID=36881 RepID=A0AAE0CB18_9CHLO|nr:hypothetical protein CYMTET_39565 [Cymbomonas tetramitiformis]
MLTIGCSWALQIVYSDVSEPLVGDIVRGYEGQPIILSPLAGLGFNGSGGIHNSTEYSFLLTSKRFWRNAGAENILIFQTDTIMLRPVPNHFLKYAYVGATWYWSLITGQPGVGNGGLSLRLRSVMIRTSKRTLVRRVRNCEFSESERSCPHPEDVWFDFKLQQAPSVLLPPRAVQAQFAAETVPELNPCGLHKIVTFHPNSDYISNVLEPIRRKLASSSYQEKREKLLLETFNEWEAAKRQNG